MTDKLNTLRQAAHELDEAKSDLLLAEKRLERARANAIEAEKKYEIALDELHQRVT
jgi:hypothetical protein